MIKYNNKIADELDETASGQTYHGNALRVAKDFPFLTAADRSLLDAWATGATAHKPGNPWSAQLQDIARRIRTQGATPGAKGEVVAQPRTIITQVREQIRNLVTDPGFQASTAQANLSVAQARQLLQEAVVDIPMYVHIDDVTNALSGSDDDVIKVCNRMSVLGVRIRVHKLVEMRGKR